MTDEHYLRAELYDLVKRDSSIFDFLQEGSLDGIWYWDLENPQIEWMSPRFWRLLGYDPSTKSHRADAWQSLIHPDDMARALVNFNRHVADPTHPYDQIVRYTHADGSTVWVRCRGLAVRDATGKPIRMLGAHTDVTAFKQAELLASSRAESESQTAQALREALLELMAAKTALLERDLERNAALEKAHADLAFSAAISASSDNAIIGVDADGCIRSCNQTASRLFGVLCVPGQRAAETLDPDHSWGLHDAMTAACDSEQLTRLEHAAVRTKAGNQLDLTVSISPVFGPTGVRIGVSIIARDIAHLIRINRKLNRRAEALKRSNQELEQFGYAASHDLKEPLRMVASFVDLLALRYGDVLDEKAHQYIQFASDGAKRMHTMLGDLLEFSCIGRERLAPEPTDLNLALEDALRQLRGKAEAANIDAGHLPTVMGYHAQLCRVFLNLVGNALKFCVAPIEIQLQAHRNGDEWIIKVADNGIGFEPEQAAQIFDIFQRLHTRDAYAGNGIGLTIVSKIVAQHGGRCWAEGQPNKGAAFYFALPTLETYRPDEDE